MTTQHRFFARLTAATIGRALLALGAMLGSSAPAWGATLANVALRFSPVLQSPDLSDTTVLRVRERGTRLVGPIDEVPGVSSTWAVEFNTRANHHSTVTGPQSTTTDYVGSVSLGFDVLDATAPFGIRIDGAINGVLRTKNDGLFEGDNGTATASIGNIVGHFINGPGMTLLSATTRGPTTFTGDTAVVASNSVVVPGDPAARTHFEFQLFWEATCKSQVVQQIGNGLDCDVSFGFPAAVHSGDGIRVTVALVAAPPSTSTPTTTSTPTPTKTPTPTATPPPLPKLSLHNASVVEGNTGTRSMVFTIDVDAPHTSPITVRFATANGTATAGSDYTAVSTTVSLPGGVNQITVSVPVLGDARREGNETFTVGIGHPTNATIAVGQAIGTIVDDDSAVGIAELVSGDGVVTAGETVPLTLRWDHPQRWRDLNTVDLRLIDDTGAAFWGRFTEGDDRFSLCDEASCSGSLTPGVGDPVNSGESTFHPANSLVQGSGPTGPSVDLTFAVSLDASTRGRTFRVEAAATGDNGDEQTFETVGTLTVASDSSGDYGDGCQVGNRDGGVTGVWWLLMAGLALIARTRSRARRTVTR